MIDNGSNDNCTDQLDLERYIKRPMGEWSSDIIFDCSDVGVNTIWLWIWDDADTINRALCRGFVTVVDNSNPTVECKDITVQLDPITLDASITALDIDDGSNDNCGIDSLTVSKTEFTCLDTGQVQVNLIATDFSGNQHSCTSTITVDYIDSLFVDSMYLDTSGIRSWRIGRILESDAKLSQGLDYKYRAGNEVVLLPGFRSSLDFLADIEFCPN